MSAQLATKDNLDHAVLAFETRLDEAEARLMQHIDAAWEHVTRVMMDHMDGMPDRIADRLGRAFERHLRASDERNLDSLRALDDQYRRLPVDIVTLRARFDARADEVARQRRELDAHVSDDSRHLAPGAAGQPDQSGPPDKGA
ncbi:MAG TPA: hypothetical protein VML75_20690 [Kofleriaceae bacterium]|nr:hypothetical protein [Kofleriaceae bacterium]